MIGVKGQWVLDMDCLELVVLFSVSYFCRRKVAIGTIFLDGSVGCVFSVVVYCLGGMIAIFRLSSLPNVYYFDTMSIFLHPLAISHLISHY
jgi:hypothetical protein